MIKKIKDNPRLMSLVLTGIICTLTIILMITSFDFEIHVGNLGGMGHGHEIETNAYLTMQNANVSLDVTNADMAIESIPVNEQYKSITSKGEVRVSLEVIDDERASGKIKCSYDLVYTPRENTFTNQNLTNSSSLKQLFLRIKGKTYNEDNELIDMNVSYDMVVDLQNRTELLRDLKIIDEVNGKRSQMIWEVELEFRNYRYFDQSNNADKIASGTISVVSSGKDCSVVRNNRPHHK